VSLVTGPREGIKKKRGKNGNEGTDHSIESASEASSSKILDDSRNQRDNTKPKGTGRKKARQASARKLPGAMRGVKRQRKARSPFLKFGGKEKKTSTNKKYVWAGKSEEPGIEKVGIE